MPQIWPSTLGVDRDLIHESWTDYPELLAKLDAFVEEAIEGVVEKVSAAASFANMDMDALDNELQKLGEKIVELTQFDPAKVMEARVLQSRLEAGYSLSGDTGGEKRNGPNVQLMGQRQAS